MENDYYEVHENEFITEAEREEINKETAQEQEGVSKFHNLLERFWLASRREENSEGAIEDDDDLFRELCEMYRNKR